MGADELNQRYPNIHGAQFRNDLAIQAYTLALEAAESLPNGRSKSATIRKLKRLIKEIHATNALIQRRQNQLAVLTRLALNRYTRGVFRNANTIHKKIDPLAEAE